jgi:hypothetical protein
MSYEIGDDELIGADDVEALLGDDYDVGNSRAMVRAVARRRADSGTLLKESSPTKSRQYVLGFDSQVDVLNNATATIVSQPQVIFRPERLVVSQPSFLIQDFRVGKNSQFASAGAVPSEAFQANAFGVRLKCDTAQVSSQITIIVTNISGADSRFTAALFGDAVE